MSKKTIANNRSFVIYLSFLPLIFSACSMLTPRSSPLKQTSRYNAPISTGTIINPEITESSGLTASKCQPDVLWTHNDSGDDAFIYAIRKSGEPLGTWKVTGAGNTDWEDIAGYKDSAGKCFLYIGEIGDNASRRTEHSIYRLAEPMVTPEDSTSTRQRSRETVSAEVLRFSYPDSNHNSETLLIEPKAANIYVVTKRVSGPAGVYRIKSEFGGEKSVEAEKVADISMPAIPNGFVTGGDISPDGKRVIICDYAAAYEFTLPENSRNFDDIWKQTPVSIDVGKRKIGEAVTYAPDGSSLILTSEGKNSPVIEVKLNQSF